MYNSIIKQIRPVVAFLGLSAILFGIIYPLLITFTLQFIFSAKANGDLIYKNDVLIGSALIGQSFSQPQYFWSRPSATYPTYNSVASAGSNLSPTSSAYLTKIKERIHILQESSPTQQSLIPVDLVTASASGLDPHITLAAAIYQVPRVALLRNMDEKMLNLLIQSIQEPRQFGLLGEPRINVLKLNIKLDELGSYHD